MPLLSSADFKNLLFKKILSGLPLDWFQTRLPSMCQNKLDPDQTQCFVGPDLVQNLLEMLSAQMTPEEKELPCADPESFARCGPTLQHFFS